jgi:hypothetical protein
MSDHKSQITTAHNFTRPPKNIPSPEPWPRALPDLNGLVAEALREADPRDHVKVRLTITHKPIKS